MLTSGNVDAASASSAESDEDEFIPLRCWECNVNFTEKRYLYSHLFHHVRQPFIVVERCHLPPLKLTLSKSVTGNGFEIISNGKLSDNVEPAINLAENKKDETVEEETVGGAEVKKEILEKENPETVQEEDQITQIRFSPSFADIEFESSPSREESPASSEATIIDTPAEKSDSAAIHSTESNGGVADATSAPTPTDYGANIPGAEPTPPPEPSPDYPKIRIKTTGLLKEPLTITEITDDNPDGDPNFGQNGSTNMWTTPSLEDPLKLPDGNADDGILALFNGSDGSRAKDLGFHSSDSEFISLDRLEERNRGAMTLYNPSSSQSNNQNPLDSLTGLPMQALAQQVSRLQPSNNGGAMHQQNVLINIQQFPSGPPPQPTYQPPPMYAHHYAPQPMHQPYQYQPPNPMYYPPAPPGYPPQPHMPPPPQMPPISQPHVPQHGMGGSQTGNAVVSGQQMPPTSQHQQQPQQQNQQQAGGPQQGPPYRQMAPRQQGPPRPPAAPGARMPAGGPRPPMGQRQPVPRQRAPMIRPRGGGAPTAISRGGIRPRMPGTPNGTRLQQSPVKRTPEQMAQLQAKKKRFDLLTPDKDDEDCQVICMQPKNTDGGLPQIESVQGGTPEPSENSIMHLSDSITLSVRNPPPKPAATEPKKSDAKAVANILATRGITVTATAKPKEKDSPQKSGASPSLPSSLNLNGAVSIIPAKGGNGGSKPSTPEPLPTVDLTDDTTTSATQQSPQKQRPGLPYRCDLCPATYPNAPGLNRHRQTYHKTTGGMCELGIPLVNLKTPGALQRLSSLGINNYIPLPSSGPDGTFALPIINTRNPANVNAIGATTMLSLGPIRTIPRPQNGAANPNTAKPANVQKSSWRNGNYSHLRRIGISPI